MVEHLPDVSAGTRSTLAIGTVKRRLCSLERQCVHSCPVSRRRRFHQVGSAPTSTPPGTTVCPTAASSGSTAAVSCLSETATFDPVRFRHRRRQIRWCCARAVAAIHRAAQGTTASRNDCPRSTFGGTTGRGAGTAGAVPFTAVSRRWRGRGPIRARCPYYLASAFGEVWMQPSGTLGLIGFATNALFLRDALDKAGVQAQFVARGGTSQPPTCSLRPVTPDAHREADSRLVQSLHGQVWQAFRRRGYRGPGPRPSRRPGSAAARRRHRGKAGRPHRIPAMRPTCGSPNSPVRRA